MSDTDTDKSNLNSFKSDAERIITYFAQMKRDRDNFGIIHADFHSSNYLVCDEKMRIIDFDRCGFGFYLYDLALALMELQAQQQKLFLESYEIVKPLPANFTEFNQMFLSLAYLDNLGFHAPNPNELGYIIGDLPLVAKAFSDAVEMVL